MWNKQITEKVRLLGYLYPLLRVLSLDDTDSIRVNETLVSPTFCCRDMISQLTAIKMISAHSIEHDLRVQSSRAELRALSYAHDLSHSIVTQLGRWQMTAQPPVFVCNCALRYAHLCGTFQSQLHLFHPTSTALNHVQPAEG